MSEDFPTVQPPDFPARLILESTNLCNLHCPSCMTGQGIRSERGRMEFDLFKKIVDELVDHPETFFMSLQGGGEPLLHPGLFDFLAYLHEKKPGIRSQLSCNGTLLTEEKSVQLLESGLVEIFFSVDGATRETFETLRAGADFEKVLANINRFLELKKELASPVITGVCMVRQKANEAEIPAFEEYWQERVDQIIYATYIDYVGSIDDRRTPDDKARTPVKRYFCKQLARADCAVDFQGRVNLCCKSVGEDLCLGSLADNTMAELFSGAKRARVIELHRLGRWDELPSCKACLQGWSF